MGLTIANLVWHMRLGLQVVIEDYVHTDHTKYALLLLNTFFAVVMVVVGVHLIVRIPEDQPSPVPGDVIHLSLQEDRVHWFDLETGKRL